MGAKVQIFWESYQYLENLPLGFDVTKGQIKSKTDWLAADSPKKRTNGFVFVAFLLFMSKKTNAFVRFLGESTARKSAFEINWPLSNFKKCGTYIFSNFMAFSQYLNFECGLKINSTQRPI